MSHLTKLLWWVGLIIISVFVVSYSVGFFIRLALFAFYLAWDCC